jgi:hypothetical protein
MNANTSRNLLILTVIAFVLGTVLLVAHANTAPATDSQMGVCQMMCNKPCCQETGCLPPQCGCGGGCGCVKSCASEKIPNPLGDGLRHCVPKGCPAGQAGACCGK